MSRAEDCLDTFFREHENERAMLAEKFYRDRYWKMFAANQRWSILPLSADDAVRRVTFQDPCRLMPVRFGPLREETPGDNCSGRVWHSRSGRLRLK